MKDTSYYMHQFAYLILELPEYLFVNFLKAYHS